MAYHLLILLKWGEGEMEKSVSIALGSILIGLCYGSVHADENPVVGTEVGQQYPDILLPDLDGGYGKLSDYRGKKVLLIHFASW